MKAPTLTDAPPDDAARSPRGSLLVGGLAALLASTCCLGPLVLLSLGVSGAWIGHLTALEPWQPIFLGTAIVAMLLAGRRIWRPAATCAPGEACALPHVRRGYQALFVLVAALVLLALVFPLIAPWFY